MEVGRWRHVIFERFQNAMIDRVRWCSCIRQSSYTRQRPQFGKSREAAKRGQIKAYLGEKLMTTCFLDSSANIRIAGQSDAVTSWPRNENSSFFGRKSRKKPKNSCVHCHQPLKQLMGPGLPFHPAKKISPKGREVVLTNQVVHSARGMRQSHDLW